MNILRAVLVLNIVNYNYIKKTNNGLFTMPEVKCADGLSEKNIICKKQTPGGSKIHYDIIYCSRYVEYTIQANTG